MHETTVRFSDEVWAEVQDASRRNGTSAAQFVREATVARIAVDTHVAGLHYRVIGALRQIDRRVQRVEDVLRRHGLR